MKKKKHRTYSNKTGKKHSVAIPEKAEVVGTKAILPEKNINALLFTAILFVVIATCGHIFFSSGHTYSLDGAGHSARSFMVYQNLKEGSFPLWSNMWHAGYPLLQFYPPLFNLLAGSLNFLFESIITTTKILSFLAQIFSGFTAYLLVKEISDNKRAGLIAGLANALSPWHIYHIICFNRFPHSFIYTFLPLPFYFYERFRKGKDSLLLSSIAAGFCLCMIIVFQYGYAIFCIYFFVFYVLLDTIRSPRSQPLGKNIKFLSISGSIAACLSLFLLLPVIVEGKNLYARDREQSIWEFDKFHNDLADFESLYTRKERPAGHKGYLGIGFAVLSLLGIIQAIRRKWLVPIILYCLAIYFVLGYDTFLYKYIPLIFTQQSTERLIIYQIFFMAVLAGLGWELIERSLDHWQDISYLPVYSFILVAALLLWDVSIMTDIKWREDYYGMKSTYESLEKTVKRENDHGRTLIIFLKTGFNWIADGILPAIQVMETASPNLWGFTSMVPRSAMFAKGGMQWVKDDILADRILNDSIDFLYLMDTVYIIYVGQDRKLQLFQDFPHSPVVGSGNLSFLNYQGDEPKMLPREIIPRMKLNKKTASAQTIFSMNPIPDYQPLPPSQIQLLEYRQTVNRTHLKIQSQTDTYLQISHSYYKYLHLTVDEKSIPFYPTTLELILIRFPAGTHTVEISPILSPLRKATFFFSTISLFICLTAYFVLKKKRIPITTGK